MRMAFTNTHLDAPIRAAGDQPELMTVTDPSHPLYGRSFALASAAGATFGRVYIHVPYRGDVFLKISAAATNLYPAMPRRPSSKLSIDAIRSLIREFKISQDVGQSRPDEHQGDESRASLSGFHGSLRGEP
jgi:hypothetical protein